MTLTCNLCEKPLQGQQQYNCDSCDRSICDQCVGYRFQTKPTDDFTSVCKHCQYASFDFEVYRKRSDLKGTLYVEIGGGKYDERPWTDGNIFIKEESLSVIAPIINQFVPSFWMGWYEGYAHVSKQEAINLVCYLKDLVKDDSGALQEATQLSTGVFQTYRSDIIGMCQELSESLYDLCEDYETIKFLGI